MDRAPVAIEFDFENKRERKLPVADARAVCERGSHCWIDVDVTAFGQAAELLTEFGVNKLAIHEALEHEVIGRYNTYEDCLHVSVVAPRRSGRDVEFSVVDLIIGERFVFTLHRGDVEFLQKSHENYQRFFGKFAQSLGFLLFEFWDHLIESCREVEDALSDEVYRVQSSMFRSADDEIFNHVAELSSDLIVLRRNTLADREVLHQMAFHQSDFVSQTTQPFLNNMVGTLERLGSDLTVDWEILEQTLNLHMGIVGYRTNRVVNRLTAISFIFLPLTFLCGVYGMNFKHLPELNWTYGYVYFWILAGAILGALLTLMKIKRWI